MKRCYRCGDCLYDHGIEITPHKCDPRILQRIESATDSSFNRDPEPRASQSFYTRLNNGFAMLDDDYEPE